MKNIIVALILLLLVFCANGQDWKWKNPIPTGNILNKVKCIDSLTAIAIGKKGTILKSTNKGLDWSIQTSGTDVDLNSISLVDKDTIYISGEDHSVFKTINGGEIWKKVFKGSGGSSIATQVFFVNAAIGYLLGGSMRLYKTSDYGKTWIDLNVSTEFQNVSFIYFTSENVGYGVRDCELLKTIDGGITWSQKRLSKCSVYKSIFFIDENSGYLVGSSGTILRTNNAGESWTVLNEFPSNLTNSNLESIEFINNDIGFVVGQKEILKTYDGGNNWEIIYQSKLDLFSISFFDSVNGIAVGGDWLNGIPEILNTADGGNNWNENSYTATTKYIDKIKFVNKNIGYAVGGHVTATYSGYIMKTLNAGNSWNKLDPGLDTYWINDISIPNIDIIYVVANRGQILKSSDAGTTWSEQNSNTSENLYAVKFLNTSTGYAVGNNATIIKTNDGGDTWVKQDSPTDGTLRSLYFKDINTGYIPAYEIDSTILLKTIDGGGNWIKKSIGTVSDPRGIDFVSTDTAFIAGSSGGILKTSDGGNNWEQSYQNGNNYFDIFFTNKNTGYVVGDHGEISMTEDCGNNWTAVKSGTDKQLRSVFFTDVNTGYAVGRNGIILKTTNSGSCLRAFNQSKHFTCSYDTVLIKPNFVGGTKPVTYRWEDSQTTSSILVSPNYETTYTVTITDFEMNSIDIQIPVYATTIPTPEIRLSKDTLISDSEYGNQWYWDQNLIVGATTQKIITNVTGDFYIIVSYNNCHSEKSNTIHFGLYTSIQTLDRDFKIYPNPVSAMLTIEHLNNFEDGIIKLVGINGQVIFTQKITEDVVQLNLSEMPNGMYLIQLISDDKIITKKIIKK